MSDSLITKRALAKTLKELCQYRNFEKISINDLTNKCGLNRQTFYYHFQDKYDLLQWLYYDELFADIENIITFDNWDQCLLTVLEKIYQEKDFYINKMPTLMKFLTSPHNSDKYLVNAVINGIKSHKDLQNDEAYNEIDACLEDTWVSSEVNNARWSAYYLNLQNIINICWEANSIVGPGRGSGVGFILLYCLDITQINPLREKTGTFRWRFLNPERVSVLDIDFDSEGSKRQQILNKFREVYGEDRVANVATFRTEQSKSAILTAARGLGIDVDIAQYVASLVPSDRGQLRSLSQCMNGDAENEWQPINQFVIEMTHNYPELWRVSSKIEGLICGSGIHAGGVIFVDEPFTESTALMRAPDGTICTQFELHAAEECSLIKYDVLTVEAMDKIHNCIDLLCEYGYADRKDTLKETYENIVGIYNLERDDLNMWKMVWNHQIISLFQMEKQSGISGIELLHPTSVDDMATLNSVIRLMAQEKGGEMPTNKLARFKEKPYLWDLEMEQWGLNKDEQTLLHNALDTSYGICESQEGFMQLVQMPECGGFNLTWADRLRKSIAKKNPKEFEQLTQEYFDNCEKKQLSKNLCNYVWKVLVAYSRGYGFNKSHTLAYSLVALQEMNLAYKYPIIFWNCACLISDAGGREEEEIDEEAIEEAKVEQVYTEEMEWFNDDEDEIESFYDEDDGENGWPAVIITTKEGKKKKKVKATNYGKIASAIGKIQEAGCIVSAPDINKSSFSFSPDVKNNTIRYGIAGITRIGNELAKQIIELRPYKDIDDFLLKVKVNCPQMINLIKAGAFDNLGESRSEIMYEYIKIISKLKKRITMQNLGGLIKYKLIPDDFSFEIKVFNFNNYIKKRLQTYYELDNIAFNFYEKNFDIDLLEPSNSESGFKIKKESWDKIYHSYVDKIKPFVQKNKDELLIKLNKCLIDESWNKYCLGSINKWEMDALSCYIHEHELAKIDYNKYGLDRLIDVPEQPTIERYIPIKGKMIPIYRLYRIAGTVLDRDTSKKTVTLLTSDGVITVKIYGVFANYDKQISERGADGKKHVIRKSEFSRGNKIIVTGIREGDSFRAKKYKNTPFHLIETIGTIDGNDIFIDNRND